MLLRLLFKCCIILVVGGMNYTMRQLICVESLRKKIRMIQFRLFGIRCKHNNLIVNIRLSDYLAYCALQNWQYDMRNFKLVSEMLEITELKCKVMYIKSHLFMRLINEKQNFPISRTTHDI